VAPLDDRIAIVGTAGSGKTYAAKGFIEQLLDSGARVTIVDPLGVWWRLRASADGKTRHELAGDFDNRTTLQHSLQPGDELPSPVTLF
jgi:DNA helicase HerA-like ATPase